ncbi:MAG: M14 family metallopeptidase [Ignavibacteria bacterium]|nr:M14 family metallopeptidase [Ignavibacteria bacterium]
MNIFAKILIIILFALVNAVYSQPKFSSQWLTRFEKSNFQESPRYDETMKYFKQFEKHSPYAKMFSFGKSGEERSLNVLVVSKDRAFTPREVQKTNKVIVMIQNGIHAGEIDGKDASMLLLRDILVTKEKFHLLDNVILLVIPILNVDGHERISPFNRINQNGPREMGWRVNATNLNLNRDYMKADSPEIRAWLKLFNPWLPDVFIDCHVTNGMDYQYTVTYMVQKNQNVHEAIADYCNTSLIPYFESEVQKAGYLIAPYIYFRNNEPKSGIVEGVNTPRLSDGYTAIQNRISVLIETHSLKPFKERVFATKTMLEAIISKVNRDSKKVKKIIKEADEKSIKEIAIDGKAVPIRFRPSEESVPYLFKGYKAKKEKSEISGTDKIIYTDEKIEDTIPLFKKMIVIDSVQAPFAYLIPKQWKDVVEILKLHGVKLQRIKKNMKLVVERYKFDEDAVWRNRPFEGRVPLNFKYETFQDTVEIKAGTYIVYTNQRAVRVILHLLEPKAQDSFVNYGFFNSVFERKEYFEDYVMEKIAQEMIEKNPNLKDAFIQKVKSDTSFAKNPDKRLDYFYRLSPYNDDQWNIYPVMRLLKPIPFD